MHTPVEQAQIGDQPLFGRILFGSGKDWNPVFGPLDQIGDKGIIAPSCK